MSEAGAEAAQRRSKGRARGKWRIPLSPKLIELSALALALALPKAAQAEATGGEGGTHGGFTGGTGGSADAAGAASGSVSGGAAGTPLSPNGEAGDGPLFADGGGSGGGGGYSPTYSGDITTTSRGGDGGKGGTGGNYVDGIGGSGGGGGGGDGAQITALLPISVSANVIGGKGGAGGAGSFGSGGGGGAGVVLTLNGALSIGAGAPVEIWGGEGGARGSGSSSGGGGGGGGTGVLLLGGGILNISGASIHGGAGRDDSNGGVAVKLDQVGSVTIEAGSSLTGGSATNTGTGGGGLVMLHGGTITNAGAITGGTSQGWHTGTAFGGPAGGLGSGGADGYLPDVGLKGHGGVGILGAGLSIINSGSIAGGLGYIAGPSASGRANAIELSGNNNRLELHASSIITGNVVVLGGGTNNVLALGGTAAGSFDASKLVDTAPPNVDDEYAGFTAFEKVGTSTWTLTGTSLFDGPISIEAGSLLINGDLAAAATTVATGALLGGSGQTGAVTIEAGGALSPGNSAGTITTGNLVIDAGGRLLIELGKLSYDKVSVTGTVDLSGAELVLTALPGFTSKTGDSFIIIDNDGVDAVIGKFGGGDTVSFAGRTLKISYTGDTGNDVVLTDVTPAPPQPPEPPAITLAQVKAAHINVLGLPLTDAAAALVVSDIRSGSYSFDGYIGTLIDRADMSTLPAVIVNALLAGVTPTQSHLPELGAFATQQFDAYRETNSANPALGIYEALGLGFSETVKFQGDYGGLSDVQFLTEAYQDVFGRAASTAQIAHFEAQLGYFEGLYAGAGQNDTLAGLHAKGAVIGQMIGHAVLDEPELHSFDDAAIAFLRAAGHGQAHYGEPLALV